MVKVTREMIIADVLKLDSGTAPFFLEIGMHCLGCPASRGETVEQACAVHGVDADTLIEKLNNYLESKSN
jgi:hybrid cluster-associated redox disulfide protein